MSWHPNVALLANGGVLDDPIYGGNFAYSCSLTCDLAILKLFVLPL